MPERHAALLAEEDQQDLVRALAASALETLAPDELELFDETAEDYFDDPERAIADGRRDAAVGFGLELALVTPVVLAVGTQVVQYLASLLAESFREVTKPGIATALRRLLRIDPATAEPKVPALTAAQLDRVREVAFARARDLGMPDGSARLLADSVVGGIARTA